jgi:hypothetical protein
MHTISIESQPKIGVNIYNRCLGFKLTDIRCFSTGADWNVRPDWNVDACSIMHTNLIPFQTTFEGILTYELQRKHVNPSDQAKSKHTRLFVAWSFEDYKNPRVFVHLAEYDNQIEWNGIKLEEHCQIYISQLNIYTGPIMDTWLTSDNAMFMTILELDFTQRDSILNIAIAEGAWAGHIRRPVWIDPKM